MAKKTQKKSGTKKASTKKVVKKTTKKTTAKKPVTKKVTKKSTAKKSTSKKVTKKTTSKKVTKKTVTKAPATKKTTKKKTTSKKNGTAVKAQAVDATKNGSTGPKKMVSRSNGSAVSERVAKLRMRLQRGGSSTTRIQLPEKPLTEAQLKKIKSGLGRKELNYFKKLLMEKRAEILGDFAQLAEDVKSAGEGVSYEHMADTGTDNFEQEFNLGLMESERLMLNRVNRALQRIEEKTYGICVMTGKPIARTRLEAKPWAQYSIEVARELDRQGLLDK
ncbi:MAG: TraR/DksA family transcriptional regulator [Phycisphaeraceae bacterium JB051]